MKTFPSRVLAVLFASILAACSGATRTSPTSIDAPDAPPGDAAVSETRAPTDATPRPEVTAAALRAITSTCATLPGVTKFATDDGQPETVSICALDGALWWRADLDVDCDGGRTAACRADPSYLPETSATDSNGDPLDAATLPFVVIPLPSQGFAPAEHGVRLGSVVAVVYRDRVEYGIFGDSGPRGIIGEASYAMAALLGIDPDPVTGGADEGATYIVFTGESGIVERKEDHAEAVAIGRARAAELLGRSR